MAARIRFRRFYECDTESDRSLDFGQDSVLYCLDTQKYYRIYNAAYEEILPDEVIFISPIPISKLSISGIPDGTKFLRDDGSWATPAGGGGGGGGHIIYDSAGTALTQQPGLKFSRLSVTNDALNSLTLVTRPSDTYIGLTAPANPVQGDEWTNSETWKTYKYYDSFWVELTAGAGADATALDLKVPYTGATGNVTLGEYGLTTGYVQFDTTPTTFTPAVGNMGWIDSEGTIDFLLRGGVVNLPIGQKQVARVVNGTGGNVLKSNYQVVKVTGAQGQRLQVNLAQGNNDTNSADTLGLIAENINNNNAGFIITIGLIENINTTGNLQSETWVDGNVLYLSPTTPGAITNVKPQAPQHTVIVGFVVYAHPNNGKIFVKVDNGYEIDELHNVRIDTGTLANGQVLKYNSSLQVWENNTDAAGSGIAQTDYDSAITGSRNSVNVLFTLSTNFVSGTTKVYVNGIRYSLGASNDYVETGTNQITFTNAPDSGDILLVDYIKL